MAHIPPYAYARSEKEKKKKIANNPTLSLIVRKGEVGNTHLLISLLLPSPAQMLPPPAGTVRGLLLLSPRP